MPSWQNRAQLSQFGWGGISTWHRLVPSLLSSVNSVPSDTCGSVRRPPKGMLWKDIHEMTGKICGHNGHKDKKSKTTDFKYACHWLINQLPDVGLVPYSKFPTLGTAPKKYQNAGFWKDFKVQRTEKAFNPFQNGGLDDEDVSSICPAFPRTQGPPPQAWNYEPEAKDLKCDHSQRNNVGVCAFSHHISLIRIH